MMRMQETDKRDYLWTQAWVFDFCWSVLPTWSKIFRGCGMVAGGGCAVDF